MPQHQSSDRHVRSINPKVIQTRHSTHNSIVALAFSPSGELIAAALQHGPIQLHRLLHGAEPLSSLSGHTADVYQLAFSHQHQFLASASLDHSVRLWRPSRTTACLYVLQHAGMATAVAFHPFSLLLLTASSDGVAHVLHISTENGASGGESSRPFPTAPTAKIVAQASADAVFTAAIFVSGRSAALATYDGRILHWRSCVPDTSIILGSSSQFDNAWDGVAPNHQPAHRGHPATVSTSKWRQRQLGKGCVLLDLGPSNGSNETAGSRRQGGSGPAVGARLSLTKPTASRSTIYATADGERVFEMNGGDISRIIRSGRVHGGLALSTSCSPDGRIIVLGAIGGRVRLMNCSQGPRRSRSSRLTERLSHVVEVPILDGADGYVSAVAMAGRVAAKRWMSRPSVQHGKGGCLMAVGGANGSLDIVEVIYDVI